MVTNLNRHNISLFILSSILSPNSLFTAINNETLESTKNLSKIMLEDGSHIDVTIMDSQDLEVVNTLDYPSVDVKEPDKGDQDVSSLFFESREDQSQSLPLPDEMGRCVICRLKVELLKDPWSDFSVSIASSTESKMCDLIHNLLKPLQEIEYKVNVYSIVITSILKSRP